MLFISSPPPLLHYFSQTRFPLFLDHFASKEKSALNLCGFLDRGPLAITAIRFDARSPPLFTAAPSFSPQNLRCVLHVPSTTMLRNTRSPRRFLLSTTETCPPFHPLPP